MTARKQDVIKQADQGRTVGESIADHPIKVRQPRKPCFFFFLAGAILLTVASLPSCGEVTLFMPRPVDDGTTDEATTADDFLRVEERTQCETAGDTDCLGFFGFSVDRDGNFVAGPTDAGETVEGRITPTQSFNLNNAVRAVLDSGTGLQCEDIPISPGIAERIVAITPDDEDEVVLFEETIGTNTVCFMGTRENALQLQEELFALMSQHYPRNFGATDTDVNQPNPDEPIPTGPGGPFSQPTGDDLFQPGGGVSVPGGSGSPIFP